MKRAILSSLCILFVIAASRPFLLGQEVIEAIVAIVNDDIITLSEYRAEFEAQEAGLRAQQFPQEEFGRRYAALKKDLLNQMIVDRLLLQKAKELGFNVQEQVKGMIEKIKQENNISSDADLRRAIEQQGLSYETWLRQAEEGTMRRGVLYTEVERSIVLEDSEIVQYYKKNPAEFTMPTEYRLNAIYVGTEKRSADEIGKIKASIDSKLNSGASFADTAVELSDSPMKEAKGDLGTFKAGELESPLESPIERLKPGERTGWISNKGGWYLLQLIEKKESFLRPFDDARKEVEEKIYNQKVAIKQETYLKTLQERSYIKIVNADPLGFNK